MMKKMWMACVLAALLGCGAAEAAQPGLVHQNAGIHVENAERGPVKAEVPGCTGGSMLQRARINAAIEAEISRFYDEIEKKNAIGPVKGWVSYDLGLVSRECVSLVLYESTMYEGAAHPTTYVKGMTFDKNGNHVMRKDVLKILPAASVDGVKDAIREQAAERQLFLFPEKDWSVTGWPQEFYWDADGHMYFIFQQYEIGPYAAGWIAIRAL